jgi:hypothetical protein
MWYAKPRRIIRNHLAINNVAYGYHYFTDLESKAPDGGRLWSRVRWLTRRLPLQVLPLRVKVVATKFGVTPELMRVMLWGCRFDFVMRKHRPSYSYC